MSDLYSAAQYLLFVIIITIFVKPLAFSYLPALALGPILELWFAKT